MAEKVFGRKKEKEKEILEVKETEKKEKQEVFEEKGRFDTRSIIRKTLNIFIWTIIFAWMAICLTDFFLARTERRPIFALNRTVISYEDGNVYRYTGLGYRVFYYQREIYKGIDFGPFWTSERDYEED